MGIKGGGIASFPNLGRGGVAAVVKDVFERIAEAVEALVASYVFPPLMLPTPLILAAAGAEQTFDSQGRKVSWLIVQAFSGTISLYWSYAGGGSLPPMQFSPTAFPIIIPVSVKEYQFTAVAVGGGATGTVTLVA